jgi:hypothetical protein
MPPFSLATFVPGQFSIFGTQRADDGKQHVARAAITVVLTYGFVWKYAILALCVESAVIRVQCGK